MTFRRFRFNVPNENKPQNKPQTQKTGPTKSSNPLIFVVETTRFERATS